MKTDHLHEIWGGPDNSRLISKQFSFRLPVHVAAKLAALGDIYPNKNRTQIVADLLTAALDDLEQNLPVYKGQATQGPDDGRRYFDIEGPRSRFRDLTDRYFKVFEKELGNENPKPLYGLFIMSEDEF